MRYFPATFFFELSVISFQFYLPQVFLLKKWQSRSLSPFRGTAFQIVVMSACSALEGEASNLAFYIQEIPHIN